jgi:hypothetical protein
MLALGLGRASVWRLRLQLLLGIPKPAVGPDGTPLVGFDTGLVPNADLLEGASSGHMINALWNATLGYTLRFFWNPLDSSQTLIEDSAAGRPIKGLDRKPKGG